MKIEARTVDEYITKTDEHEPDIRQLDDIIRKNAPDLKRSLFDSGMFTGIAYGTFHYKSKGGHEGDWPIVAIANQKNYISLYVCVVNKDGTYIAETNKYKLGKVSVGRSCIRFKKLNDVNVNALEAMLQQANKMYVSGEPFFGL